MHAPWIGLQSAFELRKKEREKTGRASNRMKQFIPIRCGPQEFHELGWMEVDTVAHGGDSMRGMFL